MYRIPLREEERKKRMNKYIFGVDLGGTTVKMGLFDMNGNVLDKWEIPTVTANKGEQILPDIANSIKAKMAAEEIAPDIHMHHAVKFLRRDVQHILVQPQIGAVGNKYIQSAEALPDISKDPADISHILQIQTVALGSNGIFLGKCLCCGFCVILPSAGDAHIIAFGGKSFGNGKTAVFGGTCDQYDLSHSVSFNKFSECNVS